VIGLNMVFQGQRPLEFRGIDFSKVRIVPDIQGNIVRVNRAGDLIIPAFKSIV
jgi:hypothetical protein